MLKGLIRGVCALALFAPPALADGPAAKLETIMAGLCGVWEGKETCILTYGQAEISPLTDRKLLVVTTNVQLQDCVQGEYSTCRVAGYPDSDMFLTNSQEDCFDLGPVIAMKKYKNAVAKG